MRTDVSLLLITCGLLCTSACSEPAGDVDLVLETSAGEVTYVVDLDELPEDTIVQQGCGQLGETAAQLPADLGLPPSASGELGDATLVGFRLGDEQWDSERCVEYLENDPPIG